jgi:hypothetical protein
MKSLSVRIEENKKRVQDKINKVPKIHWEIMMFYNSNSKEKTLLKYPNYSEFIESIINPNL